MKITKITNPKEKNIWFDNFVEHYLAFAKDILVGQDAFYLYNHKTHSWERRVFKEKQGGLPITHEFYHFAKLHGLFENKFTNPSRLQQEVAKLEAELIAQKKVAPLVPNNRYHNFQDCIFDTTEYKSLKHTPDIFTNYKYDYELGEVDVQSLFQLHKDKSYSDFFADTPNLDKLFQGSVEYDSDLMIMLAQMFGTAISEERFHVAYILTGLQGTAKSTMLKLLQVLVGKERVSTIPIEWFSGTGQRTDKFATSTLAEKLVNISEEIKAQKIDDDIIKTLITEREITIRKMHKEPITVPINTRFYGASNHALAFENFEGIERRFKYIRLKRQIPVNEQDLFIIDRIQRSEEEKRKLFLFALSGLLLIRKGMNEFDWINQFYQNKDSLEEKEMAMEKTRPTHAFFKQIGLRLANREQDGMKYNNYCVYTKSLWQLFKIWAEQEGHFGSARISQVEFKRQLNEYLRYRYNLSELEVENLYRKVGHRDARRWGLRGVVISKMDEAREYFDNFEIVSEDDLIYVYA